MLLYGNFTRKIAEIQLKYDCFKLFHIAGRLTSHARQVRVRLASSHVFDSLFWEVLENIQSLVLLH
ncbi:UNVERIFIED_CONTAM: transposase [Aerococcus urinaeequi]|nr:transposase [Aerococcus urinaeequi]